MVSMRLRRQADPLIDHSGHFAGRLGAKPTVVYELPERICRLDVDIEDWYLKHTRWVQPHSLDLAPHCSFLRHVLPCLVRSFAWGP